MGRFRDVRPVRESRSPPSTAITRSQSPEFWSPAPVVPHQHSYKLHTLSDTHCPVYGSLYGSIPDSLHTYLCLLTSQTLQRFSKGYSRTPTFPTILQRWSPLSWAPRLHSPVNEKDISYFTVHLHISIPTILTSSSLSSFTASHSISIPVWYMPVVFWLSLWQKTGPKPTPLWMPGLHLRGKSLRSWSTLFVLPCHQLLPLHHLPRPGVTSCICGWSGWLWRHSSATLPLYRDATTDISHWELQGSLSELSSLGSSFDLG